MRRKLVSVFLILFMMTINTFAFADAKKDETVYVNLNHDGSIAETRVVNHIYGYGASSLYKDYGKYISVKNMTGSLNPEIRDGQIIWPMEALKSGDIYYEGTTSKELPIQLKIKYFLDGKEILPKDLGGKSGHLKIEICLEYSKNIDWKKAGFTTQIQLTPDLDVFSNIKTEGSRVTVGKKATIAFVSFPSSDQTFIFEGDGKDIYLDPINITLVSSSISLPEDIKKGLEELVLGVEKMGNGSVSLAKGADVLASGTLEFKNGMTQLDSGLGKLYLGTNELSKNSRNIGAGMEQFQSGLGEMSKQSGQLVYGFGQITTGMEAIAARGNEIYEGLGKINNGLKGINSGVSGLSSGLDNLEEGHKQLMQLAQAYLNSEDPMLRQMAQGIIQEGEVLAKLNGGLKETSKGIGEIQKSTGELYSGFGEYKNGLGELSGSMEQINQGVSKLPEGLNQLGSVFENLKDGTSKYFNGVDEVNKGLGLIKENTKALPGNAEKIVKGQRDLKNGILGLSKGINQMDRELSENLNSPLLGNKENEYKSFADNENNKNSTVQFIMKTPSIDRPVVEKEYSENDKAKKSFIDRFLDLFR